MRRRCALDAGYVEARNNLGYALLVRGDAAAAARAIR